MESKLPDTKKLNRNNNYQSLRIVTANPLTYSKMRGTLNHAFLFCLFSLFFIASNTSIAGSEIMVTPTRVIFDAKTRNQKVTVINSGNETGTYRILLVNKRMTPDGNIIDIEKAAAGEQFADKMIRYSPRQVTLKPGQSQIVRLSLRKPRDLENGEYRSHIKFKAIPKNTGVDIGQINDEKSGIGIKLTAIVSVTIPVIVRHGKTDASASIKSLKLLPPDKNNTRPMLSFELQRQGSQSVYGDFIAELESNGKSKIVGQMSGVAVYTPNASRKVKLTLNVPKDTPLKGVLKVYYRTPAKRGSAILAQSLLEIAQ